MLVAKWPCQNSAIFSCNGRGPLAMRCSHQPRSSMMCSPLVLLLLLRCIFRRSSGLAWRAALVRSCRSGSGLAQSGFAVVSGILS